MMSPYREVCKSLERTKVASRVGYDLEAEETGILGRGTAR